MSKASGVCVVAVIFVASFICATLRGDEQALATAAVLVVVKGEGAPIKNATVFVTAADDSYNDSLETDRDGKSRFAHVPVGKVILQVAAQGWKTYGSSETVKAAGARFAITLERPPKQEEHEDYDPPR